MTIDKMSVIIPTVNAHAELDLALTSLKTNSTLPLELVVVVDPDLKTGKLSDQILAVVKKHGLTPLINKTNQGPYGSWNRGATHATSPWLVFATDDQYFAPHWDTQLAAAWQPKRLVAGRLVEPGIIPVWRTNFQQDFGVTPASFDKAAFIKWCAKRQDKGFVEDGFFIPLLISRQDFEDLGRYPTAGQFGTSSATSNDIRFVEHAQEQGYQFGTAAGSYSYHFQASSWKKKTAQPTIAAIVLTLNEEKLLPRCLTSLKWATEVFVIDSGSTDKTVTLAKKLGAKVIRHPFQDFASSRNFALDKAADFDWVLMVDADETVEADLGKELQSFAKDIYLDGVNIPRKNYIFGRWIEHSDWYPDERLVFFRPKLVKYEGQIHERAKFVRGNGSTATASFHLLHTNYDSVREFVGKNLLDYPAEYALILHEQGQSFVPSDLLTKPAGEFMRRFFLTEGWKDGLYGFILAALMAAQTLIAYIYLWELQGKRQDLSRAEIKEIFSALRQKGSELKYWLISMSVETTTGAQKFLHRARRKALKIITKI